MSLLASLHSATNVPGLLHDSNLLGAAGTGLVVGLLPLLANDNHESTNVSAALWKMSMDWSESVELVFNAVV